MHRKIYSFCKWGFLFTCIIVWNLKPYFGTTYIIIIRKINNWTELLKLYVLTFIGKQFIFKIFLPLKSLFEYYNIIFGLFRTHIKSISSGAFLFSGKPSLKISFKETLIFKTFGSPETYYSPLQGIQLQHKIFI